MRAIRLALNGVIVNRSGWALLITPMDTSPTHPEEGTYLLRLKEKEIAYETHLQQEVSRVAGKKYIRPSMYGYTYNL